MTPRPTLTLTPTSPPSAAAMASSSQSSIARRNWEFENGVAELASSEDIYKYDRAQQQSMLAAKPWEKDPHFFRDIKVSALALLKMVMHARSGGNLEVMGLLLGKVRNAYVLSLFLCHNCSLQCVSLDI